LFLYKTASYSLLYKQILFNNFEKYLHLKFKQMGPVDIPYNLSLVYSTSCEDETTQQPCYFIFEQYNLPSSY